MKEVYTIAGITRQGHFKAMKQQKHTQKDKENILALCLGIRQEHPRIGCRAMYDLVKEKIAIGRDRFESLLLSNGYRVGKVKNYTRTTYSTKTNYYPNGISGLTITGINQVWQSDITYFYSQGKFYYLVFIIDVYSRRIIGYQANKHMLAVANRNALQMAFKTRGNLPSLKSLLHHSDRGSQFIDRLYVQMLKYKGITPSMCLNSWENAYVERVNGTIKNDYLKHRKIDGLQSLRKHLKEAVKSYNQTRPHQSLPERISPCQFEQGLLDKSFAAIPMTIYDTKMKEGQKSKNKIVQTNKKFNLDSLIS